MNIRFRLNSFLLVALLILLTQTSSADNKYSLILGGSANHSGGTYLSDPELEEKPHNNEYDILGLGYQIRFKWSIGAIKYVDSYYCDSVAVFADYRLYNKSLTKQSLTLDFNAKFLLSRKCFDFFMAEKSQTAYLPLLAPAAVLSVYDTFAMELMVLPSGLALMAMNENSKILDILYVVSFSVKF